ncbi:DNA phosphorothioation-dependent restriction protein DptG [Bacillus sp. Marseille-P3661]|uniref:DNA phosphorothioation-dependent restriction protein DptG n=1 Tax=Bacillus sp. Marseille-P3661 TaxID=1936234 RepID=UPI000C84E498|nr:DNA phosphorothioation-dependent restriction protein DptG [Bacillus sp. Marseille-P3661]
MVRTLDREYLNELFTKKTNHDTGKTLDVLPFTSQTGAIRDKFHKVMGEYVRNICQLKYDEKSLGNREFYVSSKENELSEYIASNVEFNNDDEMYDFTRFLDQYLFSQDEIKPIHPFLFNYMSIKVDKDKLENELKKYGQFLNEVFGKNNSEITSIFTTKDSEDILTELILSKMDALKETKVKSVQYQPLLNSFSELYKEDLIYLSKYKDYFLASFPLLTHYYVFMYACQLLLKFEQYTESDFNKVHPLYFALEWESISKRRKAADELEGFKFIKEKSINLFRHIHTISHLSHNSLNEDNKAGISFMPYSELYDRIKAKGNEYEQEFLKELKQWIQDYSIYKKVNVVDHSEDLPAAFRVLFTCLKEGMSANVCKKYGENIEDLGANQFIKTRGSLGQVLNVKHEFLLLLTAVSVKDKRIPLNELFKEYEKRGIKFDRYSKKEIIKLFDNLNILDKKSDSGDAQYVKPIL